MTLDGERLKNVCTKNHFFFLPFLGLVSSLSSYSVQHYWTLATFGGLPFAYFFSGSFHSSSGISSSDSPSYFISPFLFSIFSSRILCSLTLLRLLDLPLPLGLRSSLWKTSSYSLSSISEIEYNSTFKKEYTSKGEGRRRTDLFGGERRWLLVEGSSLQNGEQYNYNYTEQRELMKIGHRRTQSANMVVASQEESTLAQYQNISSHKKHEIAKLIGRSEDKIKEKVYSIDALNAQPKQDKNQLFNFGKKLCAKPERQGIERKCESLVSIPQKFKSQSSKGRHNLQTESSSKKKDKVSHKSILKIKLKQKEKEKEKSKVPMYEQMSTIIKAKMGMDEIKAKKHSLYGGDKPTLKGFKHKKDFSNIK